ncbi:hypothetical protein CRM22_008106, partial [Opisthorchis felineus]
MKQLVVPPTTYYTFVTYHPPHIECLAPLTCQLFIIIFIHLVTHHHHHHHPISTYLGSQSLLKAMCMDGRKPIAFVVQRFLHPVDQPTIASSYAHCIILLLQLILITSSTVLFGFYSPYFPLLQVCAYQHRCLIV